jgi:glucose-6-phosphate isomerase
MPKAGHSTSSSTTSSAGHAGLYRQSIDGCLDGAIGNHGLGKVQLGNYLTRMEPQLEQLKLNYKSGKLPLLTLPEETTDIDEAAAALAKLSEGARIIVFFGTGGSGLGGQTLAQLAGWNIPGAADDEQMQRPRTRFYDNLDGRTLAGAIAQLNLDTTRFIVTSKSGGTSETLAQAIVALSAVKAAGLEKRIPELFLGITEPEVPGKANGLRALFSAHSIPMIEHHTGIGGRFSCLTNVGLMPALARGLDAKAIRAGAKTVIDAMLKAERAKDFAPALGAATAIALSKDKGVHTLVMMPYNDRLASFSRWYVQLWAESLGKKGEGTSPIAALGPLDQHSQLQLFMDGPREHMINVLRVASKGVGPVIDAALAKTAGIGFMGGKAIGDVVDAQSHAIVEALGKAGRPVRTFDLDKLDERSMGALLMHFMLETILAGRLIGIDPFDQPAVELAKVLTKERLAKV